MTLSSRGDLIMASEHSLPTTRSKPEFFFLSIDDKVTHNLATNLQIYIVDNFLVLVSTVISKREYILNLIYNILFIFIGLGS